MQVFCFVFASVAVQSGVHRATKKGDGRTWTRLPHNFFSGCGADWGALRTGVVSGFSFGRQLSVGRAGRASTRKRTGLSVAELQHDPGAEAESVSFLF